MEARVTHEINLRSEADHGVPKARRLLVLDSAWTLEAIFARKLESSITCRDLDGFFDHVWNVHPFATLLTSSSWGIRYGQACTRELSPRHTFIEGKVGRFIFLRKIFLLNFLLAQFSLFLFLLKLIRDKEIDVIRVGSPLYLGLFGLGLARASRIPLVLRIGANHDKIYEATGQPMEPRLLRSRRVEKFVERYVLRRAELVAAANQDNLNFALANGAVKERSTLFRYGNLIDPRHYRDPACRQGTPDALAALGVERKKFILYVGRLEPIKQPQDVLETLAHIRARGHNVKAVLAGDGRMREMLEARAKDLGISDFVLFPGNVDQEALSLLFPAAAAVVSPHTGRALGEAALAAAPVAAYDVDWQGEIILNGVTGMLVPNGDSGGLATATEMLLASPSTAAQLGNALRESVLKMLDPELLNEHERGEYRKLIARCPRGGGHNVAGTHKSVARKALS